MTLLREVLDIPSEVHAGDFVLKLTDGVEHADAAIGEYVVTEQIAEAFDRSLGLVETAVTSGTSQAAFLDGSFGSGKSHFMAVLHAVLGGNPHARGIPELAPPLARHDPALQGKRFLRLAYHLIGAHSLEQAILGGYVRQVRALHPDAPLPAVHHTDALLEDAMRQRARVGDEAFFDALNEGGGGAWSQFLPRWTAERFDRAVAASPDEAERRNLVDGLVRTFFSAFTESAGYLDLDAGLRAVAEHASGLGYDAVVLFLDELVLWLASHSADTAFVTSESPKVTKLVESADMRRPVPLISFIARQRDLQDFLGDTAPGAQQQALTDALRFAEGRFDHIGLGDANLPRIAHQRLLRPRDEQAAQVLDAAFARLDRRPDIWNTLLDGFNTDERHRGADEAAFRLTYPFSPALVSTLRDVSGLMQRERTALKVMQQLLVDRRDELQVDDLVPAGDVFDLVVTGTEALDPATERQFAAAQRIYARKVRPLLLAQHGLADDEARQQGPRTAFAVDDRLAKTLLLAALVPGVPALRNLDVSRLASLNHGTITSPLPGQEATTVLAKLRSWQPQLPELQVTGDTNNPTVSIRLAEVDYQSVLDRALDRDNPGARRQLLKELVWSSLGITYSPTLFRQQEHPAVWRASKRTMEVAFGNVRDPADVTDDTLLHDGERWRMVVDYPFDEEGWTPADDLARLERLRASGLGARTVVWIPRFLSAERMRDVGRLVRLEYLFSGAGDHFEAHADHLSVADREQARSILHTMRESLGSTLQHAIQQAYGAAAPQPGDVETSAAQDRVLDSLDPSLSLQEPVGATLQAAFSNLIDQLHSHAYPAHPQFDPPSPELKPSDLRLVLRYVEQAHQEPNGRVPVPASQDRAVLRRICNPLELGVMHENAFVLDPGSNFPWVNRFTRELGRDGTREPVTVGRVRQWTDADAVRGLVPLVGNLVVAAWAAVTDRIWYRYGSSIPTPALDQVKDDMELREQVLPPQETWEQAGRRASALLGVPASPYLTAANLAVFGREVMSAAEAMARPAMDLAHVLRHHAAELGLEEGAARLMTAEGACRLIRELQAAQSDLALVEELATIGLPAGDPVVARSLATAEQVTSALRSAEWEVLRALDGIHDEWEQQSRAVLDRLRAAATDDEFQSGLALALQEAVRAGIRVFTERSPDPPPPPPPPPPEGGGEAVLNATDDVSEVTAKIETFMRAHPQQRVRVTWHTEP